MMSIWRYECVKLCEDIDTLKCNGESETAFLSKFAGIKTRIAIKEWKCAGTLTHAESAACSTKTPQDATVFTTNFLILLVKTFLSNMQFLFDGVHESNIQ